MSAIANGPNTGSRNPKVVRTMVSMSSGVAIPSSTICVASWKRAYCRRLSTNPVASRTRADSLPVLATISSTTAMACSEVPSCGMSSTPGIKGAGLEKCTPRNRSGLITASASELMRIVDVFDPMMASGRAAALTRRRVSCLISIFSGTASSMKSTSATASSMEAAGETFDRMRSTASLGNSPSATNCPASSTSRSKFFRAISSEMSAIATCAPARASTWAIPPPMYPEPTTAMLGVVMGCCLPRHHFGSRPGASAPAAEVCGCISDWSSTYRGCLRRSARRE